MTELSEGFLLSESSSGRVKANSICPFSDDLVEYYLPPTENYFR